MSAALAAGVAAGALALAAGDVRRQLHARAVRRRTAPSTPGGTWRPPARLQRACEQAGVDDPARAVATWAAALGLALVLAAVTAGGRLLLLAVLIGPPVALRLAGGRLARARRLQLPDALDAVAAGLRGGLGLAAAVEGAAAVGAPLGPELAAVGREVRGGRPLDDAVGRWRDRHPDPSSALAGAALAVAATVGGPGAQAVDGAAASLRERLAAEAEAGALATQATASAALLTVAPLVFAALLATVDPAAGRFLLGSPVGWACVAGGLTLDAAGAAWMAALVRRSR